MDNAAQEDTQCCNDIPQSPGTYLWLRLYDKRSKAGVFGGLGRFEGTEKSVQRVVRILVCLPARSVGVGHGQDNFSAKCSMCRCMNKSQVNVGTF